MYNNKAIINIANYMCVEGLGILKIFGNEKFFLSKNLLKKV